MVSQMPLAYSHQTDPERLGSLCAELEERGSRFTGNSCIGVLNYSDRTCIIFLLRLGLHSQRQESL
jgi:hypothetical protein